MKTSQKKEIMQGIAIYSWYHESRCIWEAWIKGTGTASGWRSRQEAIDTIIEIYHNTKKSLSCN